MTDTPKPAPATPAATDGAVSMNLVQCEPCQRGDHCRRCSCCIPVAQLKRVLRKLQQWDKARTRRRPVLREYLAQLQATDVMLNALARGKSR